MPRLAWNASKRRVPRNASRRTRSVQRSPMTESVRAIVQSSFPTSLQRTWSYSSKMELDARRGVNILDGPGGGLLGEGAEGAAGAQTHQDRRVQVSSERGPGVATPHGSLWAERRG